MNSLCTAAPPLKKIGKERRPFPIFLRGGAAVHRLKMNGSEKKRTATQATKFLVSTTTFSP